MQQTWDRLKKELTVKGKISSCEGQLGVIEQYRKGWGLTLLGDDRKATCKHTLHEWVTKEQGIFEPTSMLLKGYKLNIVCAVA
jgi:hypothetical protein